MLICPKCKEKLERVEYEQPSLDLGYLYLEDGDKKSNECGDEGTPKYTCPECNYNLTKQVEVILEKMDINNDEENENED